MEDLSEEVNHKKKRTRSVLYFLASLIISLALTFLLRESSFTDSQVYVLFLLFFSVSLWITEAIPAFAVSLFILAYLVYTFGNPNLNSDPEKIDRYVNTFSSSVTWLLLGGFFMAAAMQKSGLDKKTLKLALRISGNKPRNMLISLMFTTWAFSMLISDSATTSMILASMTPLLASLGKSKISKALLLGVSIAASVGGMGTIMANVTNATAVGLLEEEGIKITLSQWMLYGMPISFIVTAISCFALIQVFIRKAERVSLDFLKADPLPGSIESKGQGRIVLTVIIVTVLFWLTGSFHGIPVASIAAIPIVVLTATRILTSDDIRALPWDTLFLVAGGLSLGEALQSTAILDHYANNYLRTMDIHPIALLLILSYTAMLFANVSSGLACILLLIPLGMAALPDYKAEVGISVGISVSATVLLPISIPPNIIVYSTGLLDQKDFRLGGVIVGILGPLLAVFWALFLTR
jgi:solute carrier family 13 (sodium-dependent dicarboxylate transporter), member 2/3/5